MALTIFQRGVCRLLADHRIASGESYVAGATALNELIAASRVSRDIDPFHDTDEALEASWDADRHVLDTHGLEIRVIRERRGFVEAEVAKGGETVLVQWARDSAFRFFPLVTHPDFGLALHPFDLATNKVLALVGRLEVRDWVDLIHASDHLQPWAIWPGQPPARIPVSARRASSSRPGGPAIRRRRCSRWRSCRRLRTPADLSRRWHAMLTTAREVVERLPHTEVGRCVLTRDGTLFAGDALGLRDALDHGHLMFHSGRIRGAIPEIKGPRA